jgi:hypothetical protein
METYLNIRNLLGANAVLLICYMGQIVIWRTWISSWAADKMEVVLLVPKFIGEKLDGSAPTNDLTGFSDPVLGIFVFMMVNVLLLTAIDVLPALLYTSFRSK